MKAHNWQVEEITGGYVGTIDVWYCPDCGARGGALWEGDPARLPSSCYLSSPGARGYALPLPMDCAVAKTEIEAYNQSPKRRALIQTWLEEAARQQGKEIPIVSTPEQLAGKALLDHRGHAEEAMAHRLHAYRMHGLFDPPLHVEALRLIREAEEERKKTP